MFNFSLDAGRSFLPHDCHVYLYLSGMKESLKVHGVDFRSPLMQRHPVLAIAQCM